MEDLPLRDIHLPPPVGFWPPAPGWWLLPVLLILLAALAALWRRRRRRLRPVRLALRELDLLAAAPDLPAAERLRRLSVLLRRLGLSLYPREDVAGLTGEDWLRWLDRPLDRPRFSRGCGRLLLEAPYRPSTEADAEALIGLCRDWVRAVAKAARRRR